MENTENMENFEKIKELFAEPTSRYRTAPLWVWNADMTDSEIEKSLTELKTHGFGGAFVHPRPGMRVSYMDENWFRVWGKALKKAKELGLKLNIYDENSYPSGFGGGHVSAQLPDCLAESVGYRVVSADEMDYTDEEESWMGNKKTIAVYACDRKDGRMSLTREVTDLPRSRWKGTGSYFAILEHQPSQTEGWLAGFANVDLLRPEVTKKFLEIVYDGYASHFQEDFGDTIQAIFTDEPSLPGSSVYGRDGAVNIPVNHWFGYEFQKRKGYDLMGCLPALFEDWENLDNEKIRHDYYEVAQELWAENYLTPVQEWCRRHHLPFTGHFMEDGWPKPFYDVVSPSVMSSYEYQDWPGIDLLQSGRLKGQASEVQQISMLEVMSAAHQFGKERVFCEAYGAGGYDSGLEDYKRIGDYLLVNGVNFINEHLSYTSYIGARKRDHPQSFDWRQPWWDEYTELNDYLGRLSAVLSQGETRERILVLNPTMTGYLYPRNKDTSQLVHNKIAQEPDTTGYLQMIQDFRRLQWDISLGDEVIMKRHGKAEKGKLRIAAQEYDTVILHKCMSNMLPSTLQLLSDYMEQGGLVLSVGKPGPCVAGVRKKEEYEKLTLSPGFMEFKDEQEMLSYLKHVRKPYFTTDRELPEGVESIRRMLPGGRELYFIVNHSTKDISVRAFFNGRMAENWDPWTGGISRLPQEDCNGQISLLLELKDGGSVLLCICQDESQACCTDGASETGKEAGAAGSAEENKVCENCGSSAEELQIGSIRAEECNVWPLEYCDLYIDGEIYQDCSAIAAGNKVFKKRGFLANPWDNEVQFKTRTYERNQFYTENSGFAVVYHFEAAPGFRPGKVSLAVEYGSRYDITVNGKKPQPAEGEYFLDELIKSYDIGCLIHEGRNEIRIEAAKFDVELEVEPVTLRGDFGVYARDDCWVMDTLRPLEMGSWKGQGYPFYYGAVLYEGKYDYDGKGEVKVHVAKEEATAVSLRINSEYAGALNLNGEQGKLITSLLKTGENKLSVRVCGSMKNCLGPHFDPSRPRRTAWPDMWRRAPRQGSPRPEEYDLIDYGMTKPVIIERA